MTMHTGISYVSVQTDLPLLLSVHGLCIEKRNILDGRAEVIVVSLSGSLLV